MNKFARMMITDGRNPYGSRGGYVVSDRRDYARRRDYEEDYRDRGDERRDRDYGRRDMDYARGRDRDMDYARGRDRGDYRRGDYGDYGDYRRGDYGDYRRDRREYRDYGEPKYFSEKDMETWKSLMKNADGTRGAHFNDEQVKRACEKAGIDCEEFGEDVFGLAMNMEYSDRQKVAKKYGVDIPEYYADSAKAFLRDKDFDGEPEEKLYIYYKGLVEKDD